jgi:hypothetical protein
LVSLRRLRRSWELNMSRELEGSIPLDGGTSLLAAMEPMSKFKVFSLFLFSFLSSRGHRASRDEFTTGRICFLWMGSVELLGWKKLLPVVLAAVSGYAIFFFFFLSSFKRVWWVGLPTNLFEVFGRYGFHCAFNSGFDKKKKKDGAS